MKRASFSNTNKHVEFLCESVLTFKKYYHWKKRFVCCLVIYLTFSTSFPANAQDTTAWFNYEISATGDFIQNLNGGLKTDFAFIGLEQITLSFNTHHLKRWKGGEFFLHGINTHGPLPSQEITGDLQVFSNIEAGNYLRLYEFYYSHTFGSLNILFGQHDLNSTFAGTTYGTSFINSSFGMLPSASLNVPVSIYPLASPALIVSYSMKEKFTAKIGIYDGNPGDPEKNRYNLQPNISASDGAMIIAELESKKITPFQIEKLRFGAYYHSAEFKNYADTSVTIKGNIGAYFISDFVLFGNFSKTHRYLGGFLQLGGMPQGINQVNFYLGAGLHFNGVLPAKYDDVTGLAIAYANTSPEVRSLLPEKEIGELALELTYKLNLFNYLSIQPNLQYIINPGASSLIENVLVATLRLNLCFRRF